MKLHFVAAAAIAALFAALPAQASSITEVGRLPSQDCASAAAAVSKSNLGYAARNHAFASCDQALAGTLAVRDHAATLVNRGILKAAIGEGDAAIADYDAALALEPQFADAYVNRGTALMHADRNDAARADFSRAISLGATTPHLVRISTARLRRKSLTSPPPIMITNALALAPDFKPAETELARFHVERRYAARQ